jgi:putative FmdB family regulatory protein
LTALLFFPGKPGLLILIGVPRKMPIYEYECTSCCNVFEIFQSMTEEPLTACPACSGSVKKLVSMSSFQLKGGGWYTDGYSSKSGNGSGSTATETATKTIAEKSEKATDSSKDASAVTAKSKESCPATA